ncbi:Type-1 fimbrial protein, A chain precursor [Phytobacter ursingii]|nr:Type-1 fimbrial protein, A chain precursor [Phytobacter ursingii]
MMKIIRFIVKFALFSGLLVLSPLCQAYCSISSGGPQTIWGNPLPATRSVPATLTKGQTIGDSFAVGWGTGPYIYVNCNTSTIYELLTKGSVSYVTTMSSGYVLFDTGVPGVGIRMWSAYNSVPITTGWSYYYGHPNSTKPQPFYFQTLYGQYYATDTQITPGTTTLSGKDAAYGYMSEYSSYGQVKGVTWKFSGNTTFTVRSCKTPDITVPLGSHASNDFAAVGSTSQPVPFNFQINDCAAEMTSVSYTFKPAAGITLQGSGNNQYLTLDSSSTASGVGVQVLYEDGITAVPFNTKTAFSGYVKATGGSYTIPMKARYVRTGTISPGTANSAAEFVMAYE